MHGTTGRFASKVLLFFLALMMLVSPCGAPAVETTRWDVRIWL
ncbi:MAG: hypothetical protein ACI4NN_02355 [Pyramidobacter sp.]|jgi:hypothetical protein